MTRFTILPLVTGLAERRQALRAAMILTAFATALGFCVVGTQHRALLVFFAYAATACVWTPMVPLTDAYALRGVARYGLNYGPLRLWGSAAFVVGALACGLLVDVIAPRHLIWVIASVAGLGALAGLALQRLDHPKPTAAVPHGAGALLRDPGFLAIIVGAALIQGSHAAYYTFASITWQGAGLGGLTIAGLWVLGVLAEIVVFALSPRFTLQPSALVVIGGLSAVARWLITAQEPSVAVLSVVQLAHGLTYGLTQVGTMGLLVRHVPVNVMARGQGYYAACSGIVTSSASILSGVVYAPVRAGRLLRHGRDGAVRRAGDVAGAATASRIIPTARPRADRPGCRRSAGRRRGRAPATADRRDRRSGPPARAASPAPSPARSRPCSRS